MADRIVVHLPLPAETAARLMMAVDSEWPGAVMGDPTPEERSLGDVMVFVVDG